MWCAVTVSTHRERAPSLPAAAKVEYAIKKSLSRAEKETLIAAPETIVELLPQLADLTLEVVDITNIEL